MMQYKFSTCVEHECKYGTCEQHVILTLTHQHMPDILTRSLERAEPNADP